MRLAARRQRDRHLALALGLDRHLEEIAPVVHAPAPRHPAPAHRERVLAQAPVADPDVLAERHPEAERARAVMRLRETHERRRQRRRRLRSLDRRRSALGARRSALLIKVKVEQAASHHFAQIKSIAVPPLEFARSDDALPTARLRAGARVARARWPVQKSLHCGRIGGIRQDTRAHVNTVFH